MDACDFDEVGKKRIFERRFAEKHEARMAVIECRRSAVLALQSQRVIACFLALPMSRFLLHL